MPIDFLGKNGAAPKSKKISPNVSWHVPVKEEEKKPLPKKDIVLPKKKKQPLLSPEPAGEVNLVASFKRYILKKRLIFLLIFVILIIVGFIGYYFLQPYFGKIYQQIIDKQQETPSPEPSPEPLALPSPSPPPISSPTPSPILTPTPTPLPIFTPTPSPTPSPTPLPDTELAPLRGALVKFSGEEIIYLVEKNGELRRVDRQTVVFANGQRITQVSADLIYTINDQFRNIRRGQDVYGQVDWDPRILNEKELELFL